jgi:hypothetical protein|tara:strand:- start:56 stop:352 length:297 start_codon:yes stop_codon:yes gene_type:complete
MIKRKYLKEHNELIESLKDHSRTTFVIEIKLISTSKLKDHLIYECRYLDNGILKEVPIVALDMTQALAKLDPYVDSGIPEQTLGIMLGNERFNSIGKL